MTREIFPCFTQRVRYLAARGINPYCALRGVATADGRPFALTKRPAYPMLRSRRLGNRCTSRVALATREYLRALVIVPDEGSAGAWLVRTLG